ncbi:hypothetical protein AHF37_09185 [Paragonimus kellicotti]|nr:hypothetical protein AHF37_09185 [Paragonimus kellicotti]
MIRRSAAYEDESNERRKTVIVRPRHLEVLLQAKDVRRQPVFSRLPFTLKRRKSVIKQTATSLHSGRSCQSSSTRAKQSKRHELSDSSPPPEIQCHSHVGNIVSPARGVARTYFHNPVYQVSDLIPLLSY